MFHHLVIKWNKTFAGGRGKHNFDVVFLRSYQYPSRYSYQKMFSFFIMDRRINLFLIWIAIFFPNIHKMYVHPGVPLNQISNHILDIQHSITVLQQIRCKIKWFTYISNFFVEFLKCSSSFKWSNSEINTSNVAFKILKVLVEGKLVAQNLHWNSIFLLRTEPQMYAKNPSKAFLSFVAKVSLIWLLHFLKQTNFKTNKSIDSNFDGCKSVKCTIVFHIHECTPHI